MFKKFLIFVFITTMCVYAYSNEKASINEVNFPLILVNNEKISFDHYDSQTGNKLQKKNILSIISQCPGNASYLAKRKRESITSTVLSASGVVMLLSGLVLSNDLIKQSQNNRDLEHSLLSLGSAFSLWGCVGAINERSLYMQAIGNYNLWIIGIPFTIGD